MQVRCKSSKIDRGCLVSSARTFPISNVTLTNCFRKKNSENITIDPEKYKGGDVNNPPLIIKNVTREDMGTYTCILANSVGSEESENSIFLNVHCE